MEQVQSRGIAVTDRCIFFLYAPPPSLPSLHVQARQNIGGVGVGVHPPAPCTPDKLKSGFREAQGVLQKCNRKANSKPFLWRIAMCVVVIVVCNHVLLKVHIVVKYGVGIP